MKLNEIAVPADRQGFLQAWDSVRGRALGLVDEVIHSDPFAWRVCLTGHSLGAALATLAASELATRG